MENVMKFFFSVLLLASSAFATSYDPIDLGTLVTNSDLIVLADLESLQFSKIKEYGLSGSPGKAVFSLVNDQAAKRMRPEAYECKANVACACLKGVCPTKVTVTWDSVIWVDKPSKTGTYLLFLKKNGDGSYQSFERLFGMYPLVSTRDGAMIIEKNYLLREIKNEFSWRAGPFLENVDVISQYADGVSLNYTKDSGLPVYGIVNEMFFNWDADFNL